VSVEHDQEARLYCPKCEGRGSRYDSRERRWRHLDTMQYRTILVAEVPRIRCGKHGVVQVTVPWSDPKSRFTALFEALVIDWLKEASFSAVARQLSLTWDQIAGIQDRAVRRGLSRRKKQRPRRIGVDETSFRKHAEYITVVNDLDRNGITNALGARGRNADGSSDTYQLPIGIDKRTTRRATVDGCIRLNHPEQRSLVSEVDPPVERGNDASRDGCAAFLAEWVSDCDGRVAKSEAVGRPELNGCEIVGRNLEYCDVGEVVAADEFGGIYSPILERDLVRQGTFDDVVVRDDEAIFRHHDPGTGA
jgi:hypothetical protein